MALIPINKENAESEPESKRRSSNPEDILIVLILGFLFILFISLPDTLSFNGTAIPVKFIILLLIILVILSKSIVKFEEYERGVILRFGKFSEVAGPGLRVILPIFEKYIRVDTRLKVYTTEPHEVVTKDGIRFMIGAAIFMFVSNPRDAVVNIGNYRSAVIHYIDGSLRSICGSSASDYIVSHLAEISKTIEDGINKLAYGMKGWGISVSKIEIKYIQFPQDIQDAMHKKAIKGIESKLAVVNPDSPAEIKKPEIAIVDAKKPESTDPNSEVEDYEKRIREIKKRIGVDEFW